MSENQIRDSLQRLHQALENQSNIDPELAGMLRGLEGDIQKALARTEAPAAPASEDDLSEQVQTLATRFAAEHPNIDLALRELRSLLLGLGL